MSSIPYETNFWFGNSCEYNEKVLYFNYMFWFLLIEKSVDLIIIIFENLDIYQSFFQL